MKECRAFLGLVGYYRRFIESFAKKACPITDKLKKNTDFFWKERDQEAFDYLKDSLLKATTLSKPIYDDKDRPFEISCDAQDFALGYVLEQKDKKGVNRPIAFGSRKLNLHELNYTVTEKECLALVDSIKKFHHYLYGNHFIVWVDHKALQWLFNKQDLGHGRLMRWVILLQSYDFEVRYKKGKLHQNADSMSRRPNQIEGNSGETQLETQVFMNTSEDLLDNIKDFLLTLRVPAGMNRKEISKIKRKAMQFCVLKGMLFKKAKDNVPRRVIFTEAEKLDILEAHHDDESGGHKGRDATFKKLSHRYWWPNFYEDVKSYVASCEECQKKKKLKTFEPLEPLPVEGMFARVHLDVIGKMHGSHNKFYIVVARDSLSGWVEARAIQKANAATILKFIKEDILYRHGAIGQLTTDRGKENKNKELAAASEALGIPMVFTTAYHPQSNGLVERGHQSLAHTLCKWCAYNKTTW